MHTLKALVTATQGCKVVVCGDIMTSNNVALSISSISSWLPIILIIFIPIIPLLIPSMLNGLLLPVTERVRVCISQ